MIKIYKPLIFLLLIGLFTSCQYIAKEAIGANFNDLDSKELRAYASMLEQRMSEFPNDALSSQFSSDFFIKRIHEAGYPKSLFDPTLEQVALSSLNQLSYQLGQIIAEDRYQLMRIKPQNGHLIYRMYQEDGLNYHELMIIKSDGEPKIGDIYVYASGEYLSETMARLFLSSMTSNNALVKKFSPEKQDALMTIGEAREAMSQGNFWLAKDYLDSARVHMEDEKAWHLMNVNNSFQLGDDLYLKSIEDFKEYFEDDPSWLLMGIDYYFFTEEWEKARNLLNKIRSRVGDDPVLSMYEANLEALRGDDYSSGIKLIDDAIAKTPELVDLYYTKALLEGLNKNYAEITSTLQFMYEEFGISMYELDYTMIPEYVESSYYKELTSQQTE